MITVNGVPVERPDALTVRKLLEEQGYPAAQVAVEMDGRIIPRAEYADKMVPDGSRLEVVRFVGGG